jgi:hypothetical protein
LRTAAALAQNAAAPVRFRWMTTAARLMLPECL